MGVVYVFDSKWRYTRFSTLSLSALFSEELLLLSPAKVREPMHVLGANIFRTMMRAAGGQVAT